MKFSNLAFVGEGAFNAATINDAFKVVMESIAAEPSVIPLHYSSAVVPYLLGDENRNAGDRYFNLAQVRREIEFAQASGKFGLVGTFEFYPPAYKKFTGGTREDLLCNTNGDYVMPVKVPYRVTKSFATKPMKIDKSILRCIKNTYDGFYNANLKRFWADVVSQFIEDVTAELISKSAGQFKYVGNFCSLDGVTPQLPAKELPIYRANGYELNRFAGAILEDDMMELNISAGRVRAFGSSIFTDYAKQRNFTTSNSTTGIDWSRVEGLSGSSFQYDGLVAGGLQSNSGMQDPILMLEPGAVQLITRVQHVGPHEERFEDTVRTTAVDPYLGLTWDLMITINKCATSEGGSTISIGAAIDWGLITWPKECFNDIPKFQGRTGVYLYDAVCKDESACTRPRYAMAPSNTSRNITDACDINVVCDTPPNACTVSLTQARLVSNNSLQVNASFMSGLGQVGKPITYAWTLNGSPVVETSNILTLTTGTWDEKDVVAVTVTQGTCTATDSITIAPMDCGSAVINFNGSDTADGATVALGTITAGTVYDLLIKSTGTWGLYVESVTSNNTDAVLTISAPASVATGSNLAGTLQLNGASGAHTVDITLKSNDCNNPDAIKLTVTYTIA